MKIKYYKEDDILVMSFSTKPVDDSFEVDNAVLEVDRDKNPVSLEILHASEFMKEQSKALPKDIRQKFFQTGA